MITIYEVACAWEPLVCDREKEKQQKYQELAADMAKLWPEYRMRVTPMEFGYLGLTVSVRKLLNEDGIMKATVNKFAVDAQREVGAFQLESSASAFTQETFLSI